DLPAVGRLADAGGAVDIEADVFPSRAAQLPAVQAHPHPERRAFGPGMGGEGPLGSDGGSEGLGGVGEDDEEGVALAALLFALARPESVAEEGAVLFQHGRIPVVEVLKE